jgi:V8-like Glu-specific endopeptidase
VPFTTYELFPEDYQVQERTHRVVGRLRATFDFEEPEDDKVAECTAAVVGAANDSTIVTAGHCLRLHDYPELIPYYVEFLPGAQDDVAPWDHWPVIGWAIAHSLDGDGSYAQDLDVAFAQVCTDAYSATIVDYLDFYMGIAFNMTRDEHLTSLSYPANGYDFGRQFVTHSEYGGTHSFSRGPDSTKLGMAPDVAVSGTSGSPVLKKFTGQVLAMGDDMVTHVVVAQDNEDLDLIYAAYLGDKAEEAYDMVAGATPTSC